MILKEAREAYYGASKSLSDIVRQLALAGIAVIWVFRAGQNTGGIKFERGMTPPLMFFIAALGLDLCQYLWTCIAWSYFARGEEKKGTKDTDEVEPDDTINDATLVFFYLKAAVCVLGCLLLMYSLSQQF